MYHKHFNSDIRSDILRINFSPEGTESLKVVKMPTRTASKKIWPRSRSCRDAPRPPRKVRTSKLFGLDRITLATDSAHDPELIL